MSKEIRGSQDGSFDYTLRENMPSYEPEQIKVKPVLFTPQDFEEMRMAFICEYGRG